MALPLLTSRPLWRQDDGLLASVAPQSRCQRSKNAGRKHCRWRRSIFGPSDTGAFRAPIQSLRTAPPLGTPSVLELEPLSGDGGRQPESSLRTSARCKCC